MSYGIVPGASGHYIQFEVINPDVQVAADTDLIRFVMPFDGDFNQDDTDKHQLFAALKTAGTTGTMVVDIHLNGTSIMTTNKLNIETGETSSVDATTQPDLTTTSFNAGDILTIDIDSVHTTPGYGLIVGMYLT